MRRLGTFCATRRKTVILAWVIALIGVGFAAGTAGSAFSENFELPSSDSQRAVDLLENRWFEGFSGRAWVPALPSPEGV